MPTLLRPAALLVLAGAAALGGSRLIEPAPKPSASLFALNLPMNVGDWTARGGERVDPLVARALATAQIRQRTYRHPGGACVMATLIAGSDRDALHDPRSCLAGAGWVIENDRVETLPETKITVRRCTLVGDSGRFDALYVYRAGGESIASPTQIRLRMLGAALLGGKGTPVRFLRLLRPSSSAGSDPLPALAAALWPAVSSESGRQL